MLEMNREAEKLKAENENLKQHLKKAERRHTIHVDQIQKTQIENLGEMTYKDQEFLKLSTKHEELEKYYQNVCSKLEEWHEKGIELNHMIDGKNLLLTKLTEEKGQLELELKECLKAND